MEKNVSFEMLMNVVSGTEKTVKGQSGEVSVGATQMFYLGTRFGSNLSVEALVAKCEETVEAYQSWIENLNKIIEGKRADRDAAVADKIQKKAKIFKNYSNDNLDAMIAELQKMKEANA